MEKPVEWVWYGRDNDGESHISLGRWKRHSCQMRYKLAEIQPTEHDRAVPATDPAAMREAALREAYEVVYKWWFGDGNALPQELILALIGEKK